VKVGDCVRVSFPGSLGIAKIIIDEGFGFYKILFSGELRMMHEDFLEVIYDYKS
tara:strand:+ start:205 stop:366 length:162 start_codon:yes stop_codon:yes gene_type:complete